MFRFLPGIDNVPIPGAFFLQLVTTWFRLVHRWPRALSGLFFLLIYLPEQAKSLDRGLGKLLAKIAFV